MGPANHEEHDMSQAQHLRLGIIGAGIAANDLHVPAIEKLQDKIRISAVCNRSPEKARRLAARADRLYGQETPWFTDYTELLAREDVDAVAVLLPVDLNYRVTRSAVEAGKHVLVEKPLAANLEEGRKMLKLEEDHPELVMMVAENFRYRRVYREAAGMLKSGAIGEIQHIRWDFIMQMLPETNKYARTSWRTGHSFAGGFVTDGGVHVISAMRDLFGDLSISAAEVWSTNPEIGKMDALLAQFTSSGREGISPARGTLHINYSVNGLKGMRAVIMGTRGSMIIDDVDISILKNSESMPDESLSEHRHFPDDKGYRGEYEDFLSAISGTAAPVSSITQGYKDLETILGAIELAGGGS
ncbi:oxidoreductase domain protein [Salinispira pacifica]|uniref:Oxidoreductase domain protein n=2 Tax=Salinispira pacifica TaxID=1307761 RepID=V5WFT0_9SPIO|nr:oxidoreductase domain protein [Salinispira pacifica]